jgi:hypothetical protein
MSARIDVSSSGVFALADSPPMATNPTVKTDSNLRRII